MTMTRCGVAASCVLAAMLLAGCQEPPPERAMTLQTKQCLKAEQRAIIICNTTTGECRVECREKNDE